MNKKMIDLYAHYLMANFGKATATDMSEMLEGAISHNKITRLLSQHQFTPSALSRLKWRVICAKSQIANGQKIPSNLNVGRTA